MKKILLKGGNIKFVAKAGEYSYSTYFFEIENADYFDNALEKMKLQK